MKHILNITLIFLLGALLLGCEKVNEGPEKNSAPDNTEINAQVPGTNDSEEQPADNNDNQDTPDNQGNQEEQQNNGNGQEEDQFDEDSDYEFLASAAPASLSAEDQTRLARVNDFAFTMAGLLADMEAGESYVYSPVSLSFLLGMLSEGAAGTTREEITAAMGFGKSGQDAMNEFCRNLMVIAATAATGDEKFELANAAVLNKGFTLLESYKKSTKNYYDAFVTTKDFEKDNVIGYVNKWASRHTHGRIEEVLKTLDPTACAILMNALYFKAGWHEVFDSYFTKEEGFTRADGQKKTVKMMRRKDMFVSTPYATGKDFAAVRLDYGNPNSPTPGNYSMTIILPDEGKSATDVLGSFDHDSWAALQASFSSQTVDLKLPRFDVASGMELNDILKEMGITSMFANADFSNMTEQAVYISLVKQVANISVDESGTEAAAVSVAVFDGASPEPPTFIPFHADHPFIFAITENTTGAILFLGCYR